MAFTLLSELEKNSGGEPDIQTLSPSEFPDNLLFYAADMQKVMEPTNRFDHFEFGKAKFERPIPGLIEPPFDVFVLLGKDKDGNFMENVALGWPPYFHMDDISFRPGGNPLLK